jgi:hypothetical protein
MATSPWTVEGAATLGLASFLAPKGPDVAKYMSPNGLAGTSANPSALRLQKQITGMPKFQSVNPATITAPTVDYTGGTYKAKDLSGALPEYDAIRARLNTRYSQTQQQAQDSLDREFAAMGEGRARECKPSRPKI